MFLACIYQLEGCRQSYRTTKFSGLNLKTTCTFLYRLVVNIWSRTGLRMKIKENERPLRLVVRILEPPLDLEEPK